MHFSVIFFPLIISLFFKNMYWHLNTLYGPTLCCIISLHFWVMCSRHDIRWSIEGLRALRYLSNFSVSFSQLSLFVDHPVWAAKMLLLSLLVHLVWHRVAQQEQGPGCAWCVFHETVFNGKLNSSGCFFVVHWKSECRFFTLSETSIWKLSAETCFCVWCWNIMTPILILFDFDQKLKFSIENTRLSDHFAHPVCVSLKKI